MYTHFSRVENFVVVEIAELCCRLVVAGIATHIAKELSFSLSI